MNSKEEALLGTTDSEKLVYSPELNEYQNPWQWEDTLAAYEKARPRIAKQLKKNAKDVVKTWTWGKQYSRFNGGGFVLVQTNVEYTIL